MYSYTANPTRSSSVMSDEYSTFLRAKNVAVNPKKTKLGLPEVEYVCHLVSATGTSFTPEKRLKVLDSKLMPPTTVSVVTSTW